MAKAEGIEPSTARLELAVMPLHHANPGIRKARCLRAGDKRGHGATLLPPIVSEAYAESRPLKLIESHQHECSKSPPHIRLRQLAGFRSHHKHPRNTKGSNR